jgi:DNA-binding response OmpR family regulator
MTKRNSLRILIVDDDEHICETLSAILRSEGYLTETATTAEEALERAQHHFYNIALLDIKLPDIEGTQLLEKLHKISPSTIKIMITGFPSIKNAIESLNKGAESYITKPIEPSELLETIETKLEIQKKKEKVTSQTLANWVQTRMQRIHSSGFNDVLEKTSVMLAEFGLTRNQAKTYIALLALGDASVSSISALSKIRREEVYRLLPELEQCGMVARKLKSPKTFSAIQPKTAIEILTQKKLKEIKEEVDKLGHRQAELISILKTIELPKKEREASIEIISEKHNAITRLATMLGKARKHIDATPSFQDLQVSYLDDTKKLFDPIAKSVKVRIIAKGSEIDSFTKELLRLTRANGNGLELRHIDKLPFNLVIVDNKEVMWGELQSRERNSVVFWSNDPAQIAILKMSFEHLWQNASSYSDSESN